MFHSLGPAHFRDVHQAFDAGLKFDESAVISYAGYLAIQARAGRKPLFDGLPGIRQELFVAERNTFTLAIESQDFDLHRVADPEELSRILQTPPGHIGYVQQPIDAPEIDEGSVFGKILDLSFDDNIFFDLAEGVSLAIGVSVFEHCLAREHDIRAFSIQLDNFCFNFSSSQRVEIAYRPDVHLGRRRSHRHQLAARP